MCSIGQEVLQLFGYSPHSPRAGFASDAMLSARDFTSIREEGRWVSDQSLRIYLDGVSTAQQAAMHDVKLWEPTIRFLSKYFLDVLPRWPNCPSVPTRVVPPTLASAVAATARPKPSP